MLRRAHLHSSQISFLRSFFWGWPKGKCHWGPNLTNVMAAEVIRSEIHLLLPSFSSTYDTVKGTRALFSSSHGTVLSQFIPKNAPLGQHKGCYWLFGIFIKLVDTHHYMRIPIYVGHNFAIWLFVFGSFSGSVAH